MDNTFKSSSSNRLKNDLESEPSQEKKASFSSLGSAPDQQGIDQASTTSVSYTKQQEEKGFKPKRFLGIIAVIAAISLGGNWMFNEESEVPKIEPEPALGQQAPPVVAPPPVPVAPNQPLSTLGAQLEQEGLAAAFNAYEVQAFEQAGLSVSYLIQLDQQALLPDLAFHEIIAFFQSGISVDELQQWKVSGLFSLLPFHEIIAYHEADIGLEILQQWQDQQLLQRYPFNAIIAFHQNELPFSYLTQIQQAQLSEEIAFFELIHYWNEQVPVDFLVQMKEEGLLGSIPFNEIAERYKNR